MSEDTPPFFSDMPTSGEFAKLRKRIIRDTREALETYGMIRRGARWLVCLSGGKDSYTMLAALMDLQWRGLLPVDLLACNLDQGQPGFDQTILPLSLSASACRTGSSGGIHFLLSPARSRKGRPIALSVAGFGAGISIV